VRLVIEMTEEERKKLEILILYHKRKYYDGEPEISDAEYDSLEDRLRNIDPDNPVLFIVGTPAGGNVSHDPPMLSCQKAKAIDKVVSWADDHPLMMGYKVDGISLKVVYKKGKLIQSATRGSGTLGDDVTLNVMKIDSIPKTIPVQERVEVRGELYMKISEFNRINALLLDDEKYSNPRNLAAGTVKQKDVRGMEGRELHLMVFDLLGWEEDATMEQKAQILQSWGFEASDFLKIDEPTLENIEQSFKDVEDARNTLDFEIDGVVYKYDEAAHRAEAGATEHHPRWQIALKFESKGKSTLLKGITWQVGRTSVLTPVAELEPVEVAGAVISRATMHNADFLIDLEAQPGDYVYVERSGEVIPKIISVTTKNTTGNVKLPEKCPSCGSDTRRSGVNLLCTGDKCRDKDIQQIGHWIAITGIDGLGGKSLEKLYDTGKVKHYSDLYALQEKELVDLLGKNGEKIFASIEGTRELPFPLFLAGLGIESLGKAMGKKLASYFKGLEELKNATISKLTSFDGISDITAQNIKNGITDETLYENLFKNGVKIVYEKPKEAAEDALKVYITGKVEGHSKDDLIKLVENKGMIWSSSISRNLDFLVTGKNAGQSKLENAEQLGIKTINWEEFKSKYLG